MDAHYIQTDWQLSCWRMLWSMPVVVGRHCWLCSSSHFSKL